MNAVIYLKSKVQCYEDRLLAKELGPPRPNLCINQIFVDKNRTYKRTFNQTIYEKCNWICGCPVTNSFFCFPCLLFGYDDIWTKIGCKDLKHLPEKIKKHTLSKNHLNNEISLALLGNINIRQQLDDDYRVSVRKHNELVDRNRYILARIIDAIKFCGEFELPLRGGHGETEDSNIFSGLINYTAAIDNVLKDHLESATLFEGTSNTINDDLLDAILSVCQKNIIDEITEVDYLSLQGAETTYNSCKTQVVLILRYHIEGKIHERFWGFFEMHNTSAYGIAAKILEQLSRLGVDKSPKKLICQTYDGGAFMREQKKTHCLVREKYPDANYIHCYAHQGNLILQNMTSSFSQSRIFFQDLQGIAPFFLEFPGRMNCLIEFLQKKIGSTLPTRWYFQHRTVNTVYEHKDSLIKCFEYIRDTEIIDKSACSQAAGFVRTLNDPQFLSWLAFYHKIMPHVEIFFDSIQQGNTDDIEVTDFVKCFCDAVSNIRKIYEDDKESTSEPANKRRCIDDRNNTDVTDHTIADVCDMIVNNIKERFQFSAHLCASKLFVVKNFEQYNMEFPENDFQTTVNLYHMINSHKLRTELEVLYSREDLRIASGATPLLRFFLENNMSRTFSECVTILKIIVTIPMTTVEKERCFPTLNRIQAFLRNTMGAGKLNALAMLSLEKRMIHSIPDFNKKVIEEFAGAKERRMDLIYKH